MPSPDAHPVPDAVPKDSGRGKLPGNVQSRLAGATSVSFIASSGPGGQNVNKVATAAQLRCDVFKLGLSPPAFSRLRELAGSRMTNQGEIVITARSFRTQDANRQDAQDRLAELIAKAHIRAPKRIKTKVSRAAKAKRVDAKKGRSVVKQSRAKPRMD